MNIDRASDRVARRRFGMTPVARIEDANRIKIADADHLTEHKNEYKIRVSIQRVAKTKEIVTASHAPLGSYMLSIYAERPSPINSLYNII